MLSAALTTFEQAARPSRPVTGLREFLAYLVAYIDTLHVFIAGAPVPGDRTRLQAAYGRQVRMEMRRRYNPMTRRKEIIGFVVKVQCPRPDLLQILGEMQRERGGTVRRLDISFDWRAPQLSFDQLTKWIIEHLVMRNRESGIMNTYDSGNAYFVPVARLLNRSIDNLFYADRLSKLTGLPVNKNEPRIRGHENVQRLCGIKYADEAEFLNPAIIFARCFDISQTFDSDQIAKAVQKAIRKNVRARREALADRKNSRNQLPTEKALARLEILRTMLAKREALLWANRDLEFVQRVKDFFPRLLIPSTDKIHVASRLSWGAKGSRA